MKYDCAIVLAHELKEDKTLSEETEARLKKAIELYSKDKLNKIIVSGDYKDLFGISLGEAMEKYATQKGVKGEDIIKEEISLESVGQLLFCRAGILELNKWFNVLIISSDYHINRLKTLAKTIFDKKYNIDFLSANSKISPEKLAKLKQDEEKSKELFLKTFGNKPLGEEELIKILFEKHGQYNKNSGEFLNKLNLLKRKTAENQRKA